MRIVRLFLSLAAVASLLLFYNCSGNTESPLDTQQQVAKILDEGSPWGGNGNVEVLTIPDGVDPSGLSGLQLSFNTSGPDNWAPTFFVASGADDFINTNDATWSLPGFGTDIIELTGASVTEFTSVDVTDETVTFSFEVNPSNSGGRVTGIDGSYRVQLK